VRRLAEQDRAAALQERDEAVAARELAEQQRAEVRGLEVAWGWGGGVRHVSLRGSCAAAATHIFMRYCFGLFWAAKC
jgi:hypothetical protein